ncbi:MAG: hypothetical protein JWN67_286 [Actinomycetia bacterium]|nr:hypothetical protein [Actinomycetes bacterium]
MATLLDATDARLTTIVDALADQPGDSWARRLVVAIGAWYVRHPAITLVLLALTAAIPVIGGVIGLVVGVARADVGIVGQAVVVILEAVVTYLTWRVPVLLIRRID